MALHEALEVVGLAAFTLFDHPVQLGEHVAEAREVLGRHRAQTLGHAAEVRAHHLLADVLQQLVEGRLRLGVGEPVVAQLPDPARDVGRERVEERLAHPGVVLGGTRASIARDRRCRRADRGAPRAGRPGRGSPAPGRAARGGGRAGRPARRSFPASRGAAAARARPRSPDPTARRRTAPPAAHQRTARGRTDPACRPSASSGPAPDQPTPRPRERCPLSRCRGRW